MVNANAGTRTNVVNLARFTELHDAGESPDSVTNVRKITSRSQVSDSNDWFLPARFDQRNLPRKGRRNKGCVFAWAGNIERSDDDSGQPKGTVMLERQGLDRQLADPIVRQRVQGKTLIYRRAVRRLPSIDSAGGSDDAPHWFRQAAADCEQPQRGLQIVLQNLPRLACGQRLETGCRQMDHRIGLEAIQEFFQATQFA
jgi:hypothetical protein